MKKSFDWLNANNIEFEFHDYKKLGVDQKILQHLLKQCTLQTLINTKGITYKKLSEDEKVQCQKASTALPLLQEKTSMIKRPILQLEGEILLGFDPILWAKKIK